MLNHVAIGPLADGKHAAAYKTPGCDVMTVVCVCVTTDQAQAEASRLNTEQVNREAAVKRERELCGLRNMGMGTAQG